MAVFVILGILALLGALVCWVASAYREGLKTGNSFRDDDSGNELRCHEIRVANYREAVTTVGTELACDFALGDGERVVYKDQATLLWDSGTREVPLSQPVAKTSGGGVGAIVGGLALGPVGAVAGYALSKKTTVTAPVLTYKMTDTGTDPGVLTVTNERIVFIGDRGT